VSLLWFECPFRTFTPAPFAFVNFSPFSGNKKKVGPSAFSPRAAPGQAKARYKCPSLTNNSRPPKGLEGIVGHKFQEFVYIAATAECWAYGVHRHSTKTGRPPTFEEPCLPAWVSESFLPTKTEIRTALRQRCLRNASSDPSIIAMLRDAPANAPFPFGCAGAPSVFPPCRTSIRTRRESNRPQLPTYPKPFA